MKPHRNRFADKVVLYQPHDSQIIFFSYENMRRVLSLKNIVCDQDYFVHSYLNLIHLEILMVPDEAIFFTSSSEKPYELTVLLTP